MQIVLDVAVSLARYELSGGVRLSRGVRHLLPRTLARGGGSLEAVGNGNLEHVLLGHPGICPLPETHFHCPLILITRV